MAATNFDELDRDAQNTNRPQKPFWTLGLDDKNNEKNILSWLNGEIAFLQKDSEDRVRQIQRNIQLYKGVQYQDQEVTRTNLRDERTDKAKQVQKIVCNHLFDLTENRVSRQVKYRPAVAVLPTNDEFQDKTAAKFVRMLIDHIWYVENYESQITPEQVRLVSVTGENYLFIVWDPMKGDIHPDSKNLDKNRVPLIDEQGNQQKDEAGEPMYIEKDVHVGDVAYELVMAPDILLQKRQSYKMVDYLFRKRLVSVEELRADYPEQAHQIKAGSEEIYDYETMTTKKSDNEAVVWELWHRKTKMLDKGRYIKFTKDVILENTKHPYSHGKLPCVRLTDIDVPGECHGYSFYETVKSLTGVYNNITNLIVRNQMLVSHPKWMMPAGACKLDQLGNDVTIVQFKGPQAPTLVQSQPSPPELFNFRQMIKEEFQQISGVFGVSRGEPPKGITAAVALQFLSEQENERYNNTVLKINEFHREVALMTIAVAGDYYDSSDGRMLRVLGKNNAWMSKFFDAAHLEKDYDVRVQNSSALPNSKAARLQTLLDLNERFPGQVTPEQVLDMLDLAQSDKFLDVSTVAVRTAEAEVEELMEGKDIPEPQEFEDLIVKWRIYARAPQEYGFKHQTPKKIQDHFLAYLMTVEMLMVEKAKQNPIFGQQMATLTNFPLVYKLPPMAPPPTEAQNMDKIAADSALNGGAPRPPLPGEPQPEPQAPVNTAPPSMDAQMGSQGVEPTSSI